MYPVKRPRSRAKVWALGLLAGILLLLLGGTILAFWEFSMTVEAKGDDRLVLDYGTAYQDPGAQVTLKGRHILTQGIHPGLPIRTQGTVDANTVGHYDLTYTAGFLWWTISDSRRVEIVDREPPVLILTEDPNYAAEAGLPYEEEGFRAEDEYDGDLTGQVIREEENGIVTYTVTDSSGNTAQVVRTVRYADTLPPEILLVGDTDLTISAGTPYEEPGFSAWDHGDGDVTEAVTVSGTVNPWQAGTYTVTYTVSDSHGHTAEATRTVTVVPAQPPEQVVPSGKVIYLTFDDGPGPHTRQLLEILAKYDVKATFFVVGNNRELMRLISDGGHALGIHSVTHSYRDIYASEEAYFADLRQMQQNILDATGIRTTLVRFPGGSSNTVSCFNDGVMTALTQAVEAQGFQYFDWNVDSNDAGGARDRQTVFNNVVRGVLRQDVSVVLQHDTQGFSVEAVEDIIKWGLSNGYTFLPLQPNSPGCHHTVNN